MKKKPLILTLGTLFVSAALVVPSVTMFYINNKSPQPTPPAPITADDFYKMKDTTNPLTNYSIQNLGKDTLASYIGGVKYEDPQNIIFPIRNPEGGLINGTHSACYLSSSLDPDNLVTKTIVFPWQKSDRETGKKIGVNDIALAMLGTARDTGAFMLPNLETVFIGSGVQNIGYSAIGLDSCTFSVWFDTENIDEITIAWDWYKAGCGSTVDAIIRRIIIRDGQDKSAWASKVGKPVEIIFYASEINSFK